MNVQKLLLLATTVVIALSASGFAEEPIPTVIVTYNLTLLHRLIQLAKQNLEDGDISAARLRLTPAARMDIAEALRLLGNTYDPRWLLAHGAVSVQYDVEKAIQFYVAAKVLGDEEARRILSALNEAHTVLGTSR